MSAMIIIAITISIILILLSYTISHKSNYPIVFTGVNDINESRSQYECGLEVLEEEIGKETRDRFYIKFYIIGILFLIFDLETLLLLPGVLILSASQASEEEGNKLPQNEILNEVWVEKPFIVLIIFILLLLLGLFYEYRKKVL